MCNEINNSKAIVLWGRENTGKTTTLNLLIYKLINIGANYCSVTFQGQF